MPRSEHDGDGRFGHVVVVFGYEHPGDFGRRSGHERDVVLGNGNNGSLAGLYDS
jgi:hypothetical protein